MRKFLVSAALVTATLAAAAPASAQWARPQGNAYGYYNNQGDPRLAGAYAARINRLHQQVHRLGQNGRLSRSEFLRLNREIDVLENRVSRASYRGLNRQEAYRIERDIARLERNIYREARDGGNYRDHHSQGQYAYGDQNRYDRDRDGRDDRYEDDRGRDHDGRRDRHDDDDD